MRTLAGTPAVKTSSHLNSCLLLSCFCCSLTLFVSFFLLLSCSSCSLCLFVSCLFCWTSDSSKFACPDAQVRRCCIAFLNTEVVVFGRLRAWTPCARSLQSADHGSTTVLLLRWLTLWPLASGHDSCVVRTTNPTCKMWTARGESQACSSGQRRRESIWLGKGGAKDMVPPSPNTANGSTKKGWGPQGGELAQDGADGADDLNLGPRCLNAKIMCCKDMARSSECLEQEFEALEQRRRGGVPLHFKICDHTSFAIEGCSIHSDHGSACGHLRNSGT